MMRFPVLSLVALALAASQVSGVHAQVDPVSYGSVLSGAIQSPICSSDNFASGDASGDLRGSFFVAFDCRDGAISGGTWLLLVTTESPDGTVDVRGTIRGQVLNGSFAANGDTARMTVNNVSLLVTEGTGEYAEIQGGTGSLDATADPQATPQFVGTLGLTF